MEKITKVVAFGKLLSETSDGKFFNVVFIKKDGSERSMNCRRKVKKGINGKGAKYNALSKGLLTVFDIKNQGHRNININTLKQITLKGITYQINK
jgi:hypothetical protein